MTAAAPELPPWVQPYEPDFRELLRQLDLVPGFIFQPVVLPSPDLARTLADWLAAQGVAVRVFDMRTEPWGDLATHLRTLTFHPSDERRAVVVVTPQNLDRTAVGDGLASFNFSRDSIAENLLCPLLWCGDIDLLRTTATLATDFWSIAATVYRIPVRRNSDVDGPDWWFTGAVNATIDELLQRFDASRLADNPQVVASTGLQLAEARIARNETTEARDLLEELSDLVRTRAPSFYRRWQALRDALADGLGGRPQVIRALRSEIALHESRGAYRTAAMLHAQLAEVLARTHVQEELRDAADEALQARTLFLREGDEVGAIVTEKLLILGQLPVSGGTAAMIAAHAENIRSDQTLLGLHPIALTVLAEIYRRQQRFEDAEACAVQAYELHSQSDLPALLTLLRVRVSIAVERQRWEAVLELASNFLSIIQDLGHPSETNIYLARAIALQNLRRTSESMSDLRAVMEIARRRGDTASMIRASAAAMESAYATHRAAVARALAARVYALLAQYPLPGIDLDREVATVAHRGDLELADAIRDWASRGPVGMKPLLLLAETREQQLKVQGIEPWDPSTWSSPTVEPSDAGKKPTHP